MAFAIWGLDSIGPLKTTPSDYKHIHLAVDKFTKWIEIQPVPKVTSEEAANFNLGDYSSLWCAQ
jgi:hypothetical protein